MQIANARCARFGRRLCVCSRGMTRLPTYTALDIHDVDDVGSAFAGCEFDSTQLERGQPSCWYGILDFGDLMVVANRESHARRDTYHLPAGHSAIAFSAPDNPPVRWNGFELTCDHVLVNPYADAYSLVLQGGHRCIDIIIDDALLARWGHAPWTRTFGATPGRRWALPLGEHGLALRRWLFTSLGNPHLRARIAKDPTQALMFRDELLAALGRLMEEAGGQHDAAPVRPLRRAALVADAHDLIVSDLARPRSTVDLAEALDVSSRVLQYAFQDTVGLAPHRYAFLQRLHAARRALRQGPHGRGRVARAAQRFGFRELGRFSGSYRDHFGELPSATRHG